MTNNNVVGIKADQGKIRYDLLPNELLEGTATILGDATGKEGKYPERNWENGIHWSRVFAALMRHMWAWWDPTQPDTDYETGRSHLWHASCCLTFLMTYEQRGMTKFDDRPKKSD